MSTYLLADHIYLCTTRDAAVLLDLRADQYHGLTREQTLALRSVVQGWPELEGEAALGREAREELTDYLLKKGFLTRDSAHGKTAAQLVLPTIEDRLCEWDPASRPKTSLKDIGRLAMAVCRVRLLLRTHSMQRVVQRVQRRKARCKDPQTDLGAIRELTRIHRALRPFFYSVKDKCLLDSLVLSEFLASYDAFPTWVIGVRAVPFAAHSWVQLGRYVLNGPPDFVRAFVPILAV